MITRDILYQTIFFLMNWNLNSLNITVNHQTPHLNINWCLLYFTRILPLVMKKSDITQQLLKIEISFINMMILTCQYANRNTKCKQINHISYFIFVKYQKYQTVFPKLMTSQKNHINIYQS